MMVMVERNPSQREDAMKYFFQHVHRLFARLVMDPLYRIGDKIENPLFHQRVQELLRQNVK